MSENEPPMSKMRRLSIARWDAADRPREKMMALGAAALSKAELLAILIGSGSDEESAVGLMQRLLDDCGGRLRRLGRMSVEELCAYRGIGPAKAIALLAACRLGQMVALEPAEERPAMTSSGRLEAYFRPLLGALPHEECHVVLLDHGLRVLRSTCVARGGLTAAAVDVRCVLREALVARATALALCHNHPSGTLRPSRDDDALTERLRRAAGLMDIRLIDHLILTADHYYSYADEGRL